MRSLLSPCALVFGCLLSAQSASPIPATPAELAAAKARVTAALQKCSTLADTAFELRWAPAKKKGNDPFAAMMGSVASGETSGSWHQDLTHVAWTGDNEDELLVVGRRMLAKDAKNDWRLRTGRFADGNPVAYVPDVALLLQQLAAWDLAVTNRSVGSLDDRPVEVISLTLSAEQVSEAIWIGLLPEAITAASPGGGRIMRFAAMGGGAANRPPAAAPNATIDLAIHLDPATNLIHQLHFRGWAKEAQMGGAGMVLVQGGAVRAGGNEADEEEEDVEAEDAKKDAPLVYENGLPKRARKKLSVNDVTLRLSEHGKKQAPPLTDAQKKLLGR